MNDRNKDLLLLVGLLLVAFFAVDKFSKIGKEPVQVRNPTAYESSVR